MEVFLTRRHPACRVRPDSCESWRSAVAVEQLSGHACGQQTTLITTHLLMTLGEIHNQTILHWIVLFKVCVICCIIIQAFIFDPIRCYTVTYLYLFIPLKKISQFCTYTCSQYSKFNFFWYYFTNWSPRQIATDTCYLAHYWRLATCQSDGNPWPTRELSLSFSATADEQRDLILSAVSQMHAWLCLTGRRKKCRYFMIIN